MRLFDVKASDVSPERPSVVSAEWFEKLSDRPNERLQLVSSRNILTAGYFWEWLGLNNTWNPRRVARDWLTVLGQPSSTIAYFATP
jgi:hypothetical protein